MGILAFMLASNHVVKDFVPFLGEHLPSAGQGTIKEHADKGQGAEGLSERFHLSSQIGRHIFTCQNVRTLPCLDWLWCGLQFHVEHHMFPRLPRGSIREVARKNKLWVEKWGFVYGEVSVYVAVVGILRKLRNVRHALVEFRKVRKSPAS